MKLDITPLDAARSWPDRLAACGIVAAALWSVWKLTEVGP